VRWGGGAGCGGACGRGRTRARVARAVASGAGDKQLRPRAEVWWRVAVIQGGTEVSDPDAGASTGGKIEEICQASVVPWEQAHSVSQCLAYHRGRR